MQVGSPPRAPPLTSAGLGLTLCEMRGLTRHALSILSQWTASSGVTRIHWTTGSFFGLFRCSVRTWADDPHRACSCLSGSVQVNRQLPTLNCWAWGCPSCGEHGQEGSQPCPSLSSCSFGCTRERADLLRGSLHRPASRCCHLWPCSPSSWSCT